MGWMSLIARLRRKKRLVAYFSTAALVCVLVGAIDAAGGLTRLEWMTFDARAGLFRQDSEAAPNVVVVLIDEPSLQALNPLMGRFPWPRSVYADLLDFLALGQPRAVVFDLLFSERQWAPGEDPSVLNAHDKAFMQATAQYDFVYHSAQLTHEVPDDNATYRLGKPLPRDIVAKFALTHAKGFAPGDNNQFSLPLRGLYDGAAGIGIVGMEPDADGVYRRIKLFQNYKGEVFPSLSVAPLVKRNTKIVMQPHGVSIGNTRIPLLRDGQYLVNPYGHIKAYSFSGLIASLQDVRHGDVADLLVNPDEFHDKIVFVGASAVGLEDVKATALSAKTPGVYIHASVASNILQKACLLPMGPMINGAALILLVLVTAAVGFFTSRLAIQVIVPPLLALLFVAWCLWRFHHNEVYHMTAPLFGLFLSWTLAFGYRQFTEGKDKRKVRKMLSQYVSPSILTAVVDKYEDYVHAEVGTQEHVTVLFSDVRGFTAMAEQLPAKDVVELLNCHFSVMSDIIFAHNGTLDKFIGDAIMAFWGAPIKCEDHALQASMAAVEMTRGLERVNGAITGRGLPPIRIGVGLNSGEVILGNIGSEKKLDYTIIGDNVNLASRLEGLTAKYGCAVLLSESTYAAVRHTMPCGLVDRVRVKGKRVPIGVYWPLATASDDDACRRAGYLTAQSMSEAFELYAGRQWDRAAEAYSALPASHVREIFVERCRRFRELPPPDNWDGATTLDSK
jgi:adenylate cyclase